MLYSQRGTKRKNAFLHEAVGHIKPRLCPPQAQPVSTSTAHFSARNSSPHVRKDVFYLHVPGVGAVSRLCWACLLTRVPLKHHRTRLQPVAVVTPSPGLAGT